MHKVSKSRGFLSLQLAVLRCGGARRKPAIAWTTMLRSSRIVFKKAAAELRWMAVVFAVVANRL